MRAEGHGDEVRVEAVVGRHAHVLQGHGVQPVERALVADVDVVVGQVVSVVGRQAQSDAEPAR